MGYPVYDGIKIQKNMRIIVLKKISGAAGKLFSQGRLQMLWIPLKLTVRINKIKSHKISSLFLKYSPPTNRSFRSPAPISNLIV